MPAYRFSDLEKAEYVKREFFAWLPRKTKQGWAWLTEILEVVTEDFTANKKSRHFEKLYYHAK